MRTIRQSDCCFSARVRKRLAAAFSSVPIVLCLFSVGCNPSDSDALDALNGVLNGNLSIDGSGDGDTVVAGETEESGDGGGDSDGSGGAGGGGTGSGGGSGGDGSGGDTAPPDAPPVDPPPGDPPPDDDGTFEEPPEFSNFDIAAALEAARATWSYTTNGYWIAGELVIPSGFHRITAPLDLRRMAGLHLRGASGNCYIWADFPNAESMVVDMTGSRECRFTNISISGRAGIGLLLARLPSAASAGTHRFDGVKVIGHFSRAAVLNVCSEVNLWTGCVFHNDLAAPAIKICNITPWPDLNIGTATMQNESYFGCVFNNYSTDPNAVVFDIDNNAPAILSDINFVGGNASHLGGAESAVMRINIQGQFQQLTIREMRWEAEAARNSIYVNTPAGYSTDVSGIRMLGGSYYQREAMFYAPNGQIANCNFDGVFTGSYPLQDWGVGGVRPLIWVRHSWQSRVVLNAQLPDPTASYPWPPTHYVHAWGG